MSIKSRLDRLTGEAFPQKETPDANKSELISDLRKRIDAVVERRPAMDTRAKNRRSFNEILPDCEEILTPCGSVLVVPGWLHSGALHGRKRIGELFDLDTRHAAILAGHSAFSRFHFRDALFLDTETTGLSGGTGTLAFLVGLGWYEEGSFVTRQLFARDFSEEPALLACLTDLAKAKRFLVTFNGRAFDMNLLAARFILNRMQDPFAAMPHLDLLHPSRRLIGHRLENSRLVTIEEKILGHTREGDIPGYEIPQRYFDWLRMKRPELIADVIEHNRLDVISMAALLLHLCEIMQHGAEAEGVCHSDLLAAGRLYLERHETDRALDLLEGLVDSDDALCRDEARKQLSVIWKRKNRWAEAKSLWDRMIADDPGDNFALIEMAKWYEHKEKDYGQAGRMVERALRNNISKEDRDELLFRLERIERRASQAQTKRNNYKSEIA